MKSYGADLLIRQTTAILAAWGMAAEPRETSGRMIVEADVRGIDSHGVSMLPSYAAMVASGELRFDVRPAVVRGNLTTALIDAGGGLGHDVAVMAMELAATKARDAGIAIVSVRNSHHFGAAGLYAEIAAHAGLVGIVSTTGRIPAVLPTFGLDRVFSTNPFAFAAPSKRHDIVLLDMSTSVVAANKVKSRAYAGTPLPPDWVLDDAGQSVTDAAEGERLIFRDTLGGLLPLGGAGMLHGGHKGYGLGLFAQILAGTLGGGAFPPMRAATAGSRDDIGHVFIAIDPRAFREDGAFEDDLDAMIDHIRAGRRADPNQPILIPGDPEWAAHRVRLRDGIPLEPTLVAALRSVAETAGVDFLL